ncbi:MAG: 5'-3' exonuclease H3TH domain-containing protein, partial [Patescibacteria group bacterium]
HAIPPLTTKDGEAINALYGLVSILINIVENLKPTHIIFCFDEKEPTFRNKLLPTYQSQRPETDHNLILQFQKARDFLESVNIPVYSKSGFEADDVIGTIATKVALNISISQYPYISETVIVTGDRDILQLVDDSKNIKLFMPIGGLANGKIFAEKETVERLGVMPAQIPDYKALVGDPSDNYFGINGIGPKTASALLSKYKTLIGIYEHMKDIPEKLKAKLISGKESAYLSYKLATIVRDVPIKLDIKSSDKWNLVSENVLKLFEQYGFKTLTARIKALGERIEKEKQGLLF